MDQQFRRYSRNSHILIIYALAMTLTLMIMNQFSAWHSTSWYTTITSFLKNGCEIQEISSRQNWTHGQDDRWKHRQSSINTGCGKRNWPFSTSTTDWAEHFTTNRERIHHRPHEKQMSFHPMVSEYILNSLLLLLFICCFLSPIRCIENVFLHAACTSFSRLSSSSIP